MRLTIKDTLLLTGLSEETTRTLRRALKIKNPKYQQALYHSGLEPWQIKNIPEYIDLYVHNWKGLEVPRGLDFDKLVTDAKQWKEIKQAKISDKRIYAEIDTPYPKLLIKPYSTQKEFLAKFKTDVDSDTPKRPYGNYLFVSEVASGKTILAILMAMLLRQKTIILVHTTLIRNTWIRELCKVFGQAYEKEIGIIQGQKATIGKHFTIAMGQTWFRRQEHWPEWWKEFGCQIFDEVQICPARTFFDCAHHCPCAYRLGITGTPKRKDGLQKLMYKVFGKPFAKQKIIGVETETSLPVDDVIEIPYMGELPQTVLRTVSRYDENIRRRVKEEVEVVLDQNRDYVPIITMLTEDKYRSRMIARKVAQCLNEDKNNSVLVVTHRVNHAHYLKMKIKKYTKEDVALLIGSANQGSGAKTLRELERRLIKRDLRCAVATLQIVKTGANIPPLNHLFITTPIGGEMDLEQLIGRIRRKAPNKKQVVVHHVVDRKVRLCLRFYNAKAIGFYRDRLKVKRFSNIYIA